MGRLQAGYTWAPAPSDWASGQPEAWGPWLGLGSLAGNLKLQPGARRLSLRAQPSGVTGESESRV